MSETAKYLPVPVPVWEPVGESPLRATPLIKKRDHVDHVSCDHVSLGSLSIKCTPTITEVIESREIPKRLPSAIAWEAMYNCDSEAKIKHPHLREFPQYMDMCDKSGFRATGVKISGRGLLKTVSGPLCNRWHPKRRSAWIARMCQLSMWYEANRINGCTLISLTGYQDGLSIYETWDGINRSRALLLKILRKYIPGVDYFWVVEPHTESGTGYPHYHLAVFAEVDNNIKDSNGEGMEDKLRRLYSEKWETGSHTYGLDFQVMKGDNGIKDLKNYLMKYISKGYINQKGWSQGEFIFNAHLYGASHGWHPDYPMELFNRGKIYRLIGMSRNLSRILKPEEDEDKEQIIWLKVEETEPCERKTEKGEVYDDYDAKVMYERQLIPDWLCPDYGEWGREIAKEQSWLSKLHDEKAARRARALAGQEWSD